ncbi:hypothetical protein AMS59_17250 [Lysinibacillus sp. FJAT-14745]|nr:hypothetical protein AMS59_17250 [Lysinibacillus sp. FJAT-14745]
MSRLGQQMFFARKCSANAASAAPMLVTKALSQDVMILAFVPLCARSRVSGQHDVGHEGVITGCDGFSLRSSIANPQGVAQPPLQSTTSHSKYFLEGHSNL